MPHRSPARRPYLVAAALLLTPAAATAAPGLTGTLVGARGATVMAVAPDGAAVEARTGRTGAFSLRLPDRFRGAGLHVVGADGRYLGPVVLHRRGRVAATALRVTRGRLGGVRARRGWFVLDDAAGGRRIAGAATVAVDAAGRPLGAGRLGLARRPAGARIAQAGGGGAGPGADPDRDGLPAVLDTDDNGNGILDAFDPAAGSGSSSGLFTTLFLRMTDSLNANAGLQEGAVDRVLSGDGSFGMVHHVDPAAFPGRRVTGVHVDCGRLAYCRVPDGTAVISGLSESSPDLPRGARWATYSPDGSGFPNLERITGGDGRVAFAMGIQPRVGSDRMRPGDVMDVVARTTTGEVRRPTALAPYFVTVPALRSWSTPDASGTVGYPVALNAEGTTATPLELASGVVTLTFWRPQRPSIPGAEPGAYQDIGHLDYGVVVSAPSREFGCAGHYSALSPTLSARAGDDPATRLFTLRDAAADAPASASRTLSFTVDVAGCLAANGAPASGTVDLALTAAGQSRPGGSDRAAQIITVRLP